MIPRGRWQEALKIVRERPGKGQQALLEALQDQDMPKATMADLADIQREIKPSASETDARKGFESLFKKK